MVKTALYRIEPVHSEDRQMQPARNAPGRLPFERRRNSALQSGLTDMQEVVLL